MVFPGDGLLSFALCLHFPVVYCACSYFQVSLARQNVLILAKLSFFDAESPRFYFIKHQYTDTIKVLDIMSKTNGKGSCQITEEELMRDQQKDSDDEEEHISVISDGTFIAKLARRWPIIAPMMDLFHPSIKRTTILMVIVWWALNFGWYGLTLWLPSLFSKVRTEAMFEPH